MKINTELIEKDSQVDEIFPSVLRYVLGPQKWSSYLIKGNKNILIDAMYPVGEKVDILILTHVHYDHLFFANWIIKTHKCKVYASEEVTKEVKTMGALTLSEYMKKNAYAKQLIDPYEIHPFEVDHILEDGEVLDIETFKLKVIFTPGHSPGSICLYESNKKILFSGDTWFNEELFGTTKYFGGNEDLLQKSISKLKKLDIKMFCPGHSYDLKF